MVLLIYWFDVVTDRAARWGAGGEAVGGAREMWLFGGLAEGAVGLERSGGVGGGTWLSGGRRAGRRRGDWRRFGAGAALSAGVGRGGVAWWSGDDALWTQSSHRSSPASEAFQ
jgi:hypothetical protein